MNKQKLLFSFILLSIVLFFGCKKESDNSNLPISSFEIVDITDNQVYFKNNSTSYDKIIWEFGDGAISSLSKSDESPAIGHIYTEIGTYTVQLTVQNSEGSNSSSKSVTISNMATITSAEITSVTNVSSTKSLMNYTLSAGPYDNHAKFYFQISLTADFSVLEDADYWTTGYQDEMEIGTTLSDKDIKDLTPDETYYIRFKIKTFNTNNGDKISYSNIIEFKTLQLPQPAIIASDGDSNYDFNLISSLAIDDIYAEITFIYEAARDVDFQDIVKLERRPSYNQYYREANTNLYIRVTATVNGKSSSATTTINTPEKYLTGTNDFNLAGTDVVFTNNKSVLTIGDLGGERIVFRFDSPVSEGDSIQFPNGSGSNMVKYYDASGTEFELNNSDPGSFAYLHIYDLNTANAYIRLGSMTDSDIGMRFKKIGDTETRLIWGLIAKANIQ